MSRRRWIPLALLALAVVLALLLWRPRGDGEGEPVVAGDPAPSPPATAVEPSAPPPPGGEPVPGSSAPVRLVAAEASPEPGADHGAFEGQVIDWGTGRGVDGAELTFFAAGETHTLVTDATGAFRFAPPATAIYSLATVSAPGYLPFAPELDASPARLVARPGVRVHGLRFYLSPAIDYRGTVVDAAGAPVAGAEIRLPGADEGERALMPIRARYTSGADGTFTFHAPDFQRLEASHPVAGRGHAIVDGAVQVSRRVEIRLDPARPPPAPIRGRVVGVDRQPLPGAEVRAEVMGAPGQESGLVTLADEIGRFAIEVSPGIRHRLVARAADHAPSAPVVAQAGDVEVELMVRPGASIVGRVVDGAGEPVPAFTVVALREDGLARVPAGHASVFDAGGAFRLEGLEAGDYLVVASALGRAPSPETPARAAAGGGPDIELTLSAGGTLVGTVIDADSRAPLALAKVTAEGAVGTGADSVLLAASAITDDAGRFELTGLAPGRRSVTVGAHAHHGRIIGGLEVTEGARLGPIEVALTPVAEGEEPRIELAGIGAQLTATDEGLEVLRLIEGGGALEVGMAVGDVIVGVEGARVTELGFGDALQRIRGPEGTTVRLTIRRGDRTFERAAPRRKIRA